MAPRKEYHSALVPALDALIGDPSLIVPLADSKRKADDFFIPIQYIDRVRDFRDEQSSRGEAATKLLDAFKRIWEAIHYTEDSDVFVCDNGTRIRFVPSRQLDLTNTAGRTGSTTHALATARYAQDLLGKSEVAILTGDNYMSAKALSSDIDVAHINPDIYTGRRKYILPAQLCDSWFKERRISADAFAEAFPGEEPLRINEFVEFEIDPAIAETYVSHCLLGNYGKFIGRFEPNRKNGENELQQLHYIDDLPRSIQPRSAGQAMLAETLMAPADEIPIVICPSVFGTGKTFLATALGMHFVASEEPQYERIFVVPRDAELGKEIGFLPGSEEEKTIAKAMPIVDNVRAYIKSKGDRKKGNIEMSPQDISKRVEMALEKYFEFVSIINMGGRSIPDSWIIYDEAQDMERFQINQLMKRIGDGSKMVIIGDPNQVFNKHMSYHSNGLMYAATKMAGSSYAAVVSMTEGEITRSAAAREIAKRLDH